MYFLYILSLSDNRGIGGNDSAPDWLNEILQSIDLTTTIAGAQGLTLVSGMTLGALFMGLPGTVGDETDSGVVSLSSLVQSAFNPPFPITLNVRRVLAILPVLIH